MRGGNYFKQGVSRSIQDGLLIFKMLRMLLAAPFALLTLIAVFVAVLSGIIGALISGKSKQIKDFL